MGSVMGTIGFFLLVFSGFFVALSFMGGFAGAIAGGGREDRTLRYNFGIGVVGSLIGTGIWTAITGEMPEEVTAGALALSFVASICVAFVANWRERRQAEDQHSDSQGVSV
jgi:fucose permease